MSLAWRPVPNAVAYNVYGSATATTRGGRGMGPPNRVHGTTFTDPAPSVGGETRHYRIEALLRQDPSGELPGPRAAVQVVPPSGPPGWIGASFDERGQSGSVSWQPRTEVITLRGSGTDFWARADSGYFAGVPADGDRQISVRALTRPRDTSGWAKAGLMLREGLAPDSRNVAFLLTAEGGLFLQSRAALGGGCEGNSVLSDAALQRLPRGKLLLRLNCRRDEVRAEYSRDGGLSFRPAGKPIRLSPPLHAPVYAGLAITSNDPDQVSEAKFRDLRIEPLGRR